MKANSWWVDRIEISRFLQEKVEDLNFENCPCKLYKDYLHGVGFISYLGSAKVAHLFSELLRYVLTFDFFYPENDMILSYGFIWLYG